VCENGDGWALAVLIKETPDSIQGKQRIQLGLVIRIIYYATTRSAGPGQQVERQFAVPEACGLSADWFNVKEL
jgi:hypothetical protein